MSVKTNSPIKHACSENRIASNKKCNKMAACFTIVKMGSSVVEHFAAK